MSNHVEDWMGFLYSTVPKFKTLLLKNVILPGTHDSGTGVLPIKDSHIEGSGGFVSWLTDIGFVKKIISKFTKTQYYGIKWQLESGVRFFDFRVYFKKNGDAYFHHGVVFIDYKILDAIRIVFNFLLINNNPSFDNYAVMMKKRKMGQTMPFLHSGNSIVSNSNNNSMK